MRRFLAILAAGAIFCGLGAGCQKKDESVQSAMDFRTALMAATDCDFTAKVTASYAERAYDFTVDCNFSPKDGGAELTVTAPETIAGIHAAVDGETAEVSFDDVRLELGTMAGGHVAPMQLPQLLGAAWTAGYIVSTAETADGSLNTYRSGSGEGELEILTYFTPENTPYLAEIYAQGDCVLSAQIENFSMA